MKVEYIDENTERVYFNDEKDSFIIYDKNGLKSTESWWKIFHRHNESGPALIIYPDFYKYYLDNIEMSYEEWVEKTQ